MSSALRLVSNNARFIARPSRLGAIRAFHSPYTVLGDAPRRSTTNINQQTKVDEYEALAGQRTYVVSPDVVNDKHYEVPSGAYPVSTPYINVTATEAPSAQVSSTSASLAAHPYTTRTVLHNKSGVGASASVRHAEAPGEMGEEGGSFGGLGMMDEVGTTPPGIKPTERNHPPDGSVAEKFSKLGLKDAWKERK